jgi:superfamily I DNA/RNA helicase
MTAFKPSIYQESIFNWIREGKGNAVVKAVAGSGKTTTLVQCSKIIDSNNCIFLAFNDHIAKELQSKFDNNVKVKTIHSIGFGACRTLAKKDKFCKKKPVLDTDKYLKYIENLFQLYFAENNIISSRDRNDFLGVINNLYGLIRLNLIQSNDMASIDKLLEHHSFERKMRSSKSFRNISISSFRDTLCKSLPSLMEKGQTLASEIIDYHDMVWIPNYLNISLRKYDWVLVDEAQDLNAAQLQIVLNSTTPNGRIIFVGDKSQAIYGFAGADCDSIDNIIKKTNANVLPLSISYRCPKTHIALAQKIVPEIESHHDNIQGQISHPHYDNIFKTVKAGDLVICRNKKPLEELHEQLTRKSIPSKIVDGTSEGGNSRILTAVNLIKPILPQKIFRCLMSILFSEEMQCVRLSTIHKAKGLEANSVYFIDQHLIPSRFAEKDWEIEQESNLKYIALTRAKMNLFFCETPKR